MCWTSGCPPTGILEGDARDELDAEGGGWADIDGDSEGAGANTARWLCVLEKFRTPSDASETL